MKTDSLLTKMLLALITAASLAACGADDDEKGEPKPVVEMKTSMGTITIELNRKDSPISVGNFLRYVEKEHYDDTIFHRVKGDFMIQGGGFEKGEIPTEKETMEPIRNEAKINGLKNEKYTVALARTDAPHTATSQFFINVADNREGLDPGGFSPDGYAVFGKVIDGIDVVEKIKAVDVGAGNLNSRYRGKVVSGSHEDVPVEQVVIESVRLVKKVAEEAKK